MLHSLGIRQGLVENMLERRLEELSGVKVNRGWSFLDAELYNNNDEIVNVQIQSTYGETRKMQAKYVVGCDGGKSIVRRVLRDKYGVTLDGDAHDSRWSAVDVVGLRSEFADLRHLSILHGHDSSVLVIPREPIEGKSCVRFYCQLPDDHGKDKVAAAANGNGNDKQEDLTFEDVVQVVKSTFAPFTIEWDEVHWFTIYRVGQRLVSSFDVQRRIFIAGDAAHLHSPKGGLGMNTSLLDAHNLATKIGLVEKWGASRRVLDTYSQERRMVAEQLLDMDRQLIKHMAADKQHDGGEALRAFQRKSSAYQSGTSIIYPPNVLVSQGYIPEYKEGSTRGLIAGSRLLPATVTKYEDANPVPILEALKPYDGHFTVFLCLGHASSISVTALLAHIASRPGSLYARSSSSAANTPLLRLVAVTLKDHHSLDVTHTLQPALAANAVDALYCDDIPCLSPYSSTPTVMNSPLHTKWHVDAEKGRLVVVRPDGHVGALTNALDEWDAVEAYFAQWLGK